MTRFALMLISAFFLAGCGLAVTPAPIIPTRVPPTPISTHLPAVATDIPAGFDSANPVQVVIVGDAENAADNLEEELNAISPIEMDVVLVSSQVEAMALLCDSESGTVSAAWLSGTTYPAARACGIITLQAEQGTQRLSETGEAGVLVINAEFAEDGLSAALEENFCRLSVNDFYSWLVPMMLFGVEEIDPASIADINEYEDNDALVAALASGECAAIGMSETAWEEYLDADDALSEATVVVATSAEFPHHIMAFPFGADLEVINDIIAALLQIDAASGRSELESEEAEATAEATSDPEATEAPEIEIDEDDLTALFGEGYFIPASSGDFSILDNFLESTGLNFAQIGQ